MFRPVASAMADLRPIKWKHSWSEGESLPAAAALRAVRERRLNGLLQHGCVYVATDAKTAWWLDRCCLGRQQRGIAAVGVADDWLAAARQVFLDAQQAARQAKAAQSAGAAEATPGQAEAAPQGGEPPVVAEDAAPGTEVGREPQGEEPPAGGEPPAKRQRASPPVSITLMRFSMLEAMFLMHGLEVLTLYEPAVRSPRGCSLSLETALTPPACLPVSLQPVDADDVASRAPGVDTEEQLQRWTTPQTAQALSAWRSTGDAPEALRPLLGAGSLGAAPSPGAAAAQPAMPDGVAASAGPEVRSKVQWKGRHVGNAAATAAAAAAGAAAAASAAAAAAAAVPPGYRRLGDADVWHAAVSACPGFLPAYAAYYHCRSRGWLIRSGLQYGADYVLYPRHPTAAHSTLCALVIPPSEGPGSASASAAAVRAGWPQWTELQALSRLCVQVNKGLVLLHVVPALDDDATLVVPPQCKVVGQGPRGATAASRVAAAEAASAAANGVKVGGGAAATVTAHLSRVRVVEVEVSRWNPGKGRMEVQVMPSELTNE